MKFWSRYASFGFKIPNLSEAEINATFPGTVCKILNGKLVAANIREQCKKLSIGRKTPSLTVLLIGDDPASKVYVANKEKAFADIGFFSKTIRVSSAEANDNMLCQLIESLNNDANVDGILVQLPMPNHIDSSKILKLINPEKDVDGFLVNNIGYLAMGENAGIFPCTPFGIMVLLASYNFNFTGKNAVVVGRSNIVGKPMSFFLINADSTVTVAHSKTLNLPAVCKSADLLIAAVGKPKIITPEFVKPGAMVVDVGIHNDIDGSLCGDVDKSVREIASAITPVPGGVGPLTIAMLCMNTAIAAWNK